MSKMRVLLTVLVVLLALGPVYSLSTGSGTDSLLVEMYADDLDSIEVSYLGITENNNDYRMHAVKGKGRSWYFVVSDEKSIHTFSKKGKKGELKTNSLLTTQALLTTIEKGGYRKKGKRKKVNDINLYCFYKFKKDGRKLLKRIHRVEDEDTGSWVLKALGAPFKPIVSIFQSKDKKEEVKEELIQKKLEKLQDKQAELTEKIAKK